MLQPAAKAGPVQTTPAAVTAAKVTPALVTPAPAVTAPKTASADLPRLGPMTADPNTHPAPPPPKPPDSITSSPWLPDGFQGDTNLMNRAQHENTMNAWLQNYTKWSNDQKTQIYQQAMYNWQLNSQRCQELGIDGPPKPPPPKLDPIEPKPAGWWFA